jgi:serine/threonine protein kinase
VLVADGDEADVEMTGTREMMGSPLYMSPEQAKSARDVDLRTDIWALGAILYKLLTGSTPVGGQTVAEVSFALLEKTAVRPPSELRPDIPRQLEACILRCLEKNVHRRYRRVTELMAALAPFATRRTNLAEDEDNVATVLHSIGKSRTNTDGAGSTMLMHEAHVDQWDAQKPKRERERSGTDVLPPYRASARVRNDLASPGPVYPAQTTQPLNGHDLRAAIETFRPVENKPSFTERVHLPPVSANALPPTPAPTSVSPKPGPFPLKASFQGPAIRPPPIPPPFPTGVYPIAPAARVTLPSGSKRLPIPEQTAPPWERRGSQRNGKNARRMFVPLAAVFGIVGFAILAFLISAYPGQLTAASETSKSASASAAAPPNKPASSPPGAAISPTNARDSAAKTINTKPSNSATK